MIRSSEPSGRWTFSLDSSFAASIALPVLLPWLVGRRGHSFQAIALARPARLRCSRAGQAAPAGRGIEACSGGTRTWSGDSIGVLAVGLAAAGITGLRGEAGGCRTARKVRHRGRSNVSIPRPRQDYPHECPRGAAGGRLRLVRGAGLGSIRKEVSPFTSDDCPRTHTGVSMGARASTQRSSQLKPSGYTVPLPAAASQAPTAW